MAELSPLQLPAEALEAMVAHALAEYPLEMCGLLVGEGQVVRRFVPCDNEAASAKVYTVPPIQLLRAEREAEADGLGVIGVAHSHTHTEPYPSPTDIAQAPDPTWHYVIVSLKRILPETRCFVLDGDAVHEREVVVGSDKSD